MNGIPDQCRADYMPICPELFIKPRTGRDREGEKSNGKPVLTMESGHNRKLIETWLEDDVSMDVTSSIQ